MVGLFILFGWAVVGLIVAGIERRLRDGDEAPVTVLCVFGAIAGGFAGQVTRLYVFGEPLGFLFAAGGAELLLRLYRNRESAPPAPAGSTRDVPAAPPVQPAGIRLVEAFGWATLGGMAVGAGGLLGLVASARLYPQRYSQFPVEIFFVPLGIGLGFLGSGITRLARPRWTATQMFVLVGALAIGYTAIVANWGRNNARPAKVVVTFEPDPGSAEVCTPATCAAATPPMEWTVQGVLHVQETAGFGGMIDAIEVTSLSFRNGRFVAGSIQGPNVQYTAREAGGPRWIRAGEIASYPLRYGYRTGDGNPRRTINVGVQFTDSAGHHAFGGGQWTVR